MPATDTFLANGSWQVVLRPNASLTRAGARGFLALIGSMTIAIALFFALRGSWPVLPFAGLEIGVLAWALRASMRTSRWQEVILVGSDSIRVERHDNRGLHCSEFARHWSRVTLRAAAATAPSRLLIESRGRGCEVGRFLSEGERNYVARRLRQLVGGINASPRLDQA